MHNVNTEALNALDALLWADTYVESETGELEAFQNYNYSHDYTVDPAILSTLTEYLTDFIDGANEHGWLHDVPSGKVGHDFIFTANRHGAGFWDHDYEFKGELTEFARSFGTFTAYYDANTNTIMPWGGF